MAPGVRLRGDTSVPLPDSGSRGTGTASAPELAPASVLTSRSQRRRGGRSIRIRGVAVRYGRRTASTCS